MSQFSRPRADVSNNLWVEPPVYSKVNEITPDDNSYVISSGSDTGDSFEVELDDIIAPSIEIPPVTGSWTLRVRLGITGDGSGYGSGGSGGSGSGPVWVKVEFRQALIGGGVQTIAEIANEPPTTALGDFVLAVPPADLARIEYDENGRAGGLRARVTTLLPIPVVCCPPGVKVPPKLYATFTNTTGPCSYLAGVTVPLIYDPALNGWNGRFAACETGLLTLVCLSGFWVLGGGGAIQGSQGASSVQCGPLLLFFPSMIMGGCCATGTTNFIVSETSP